MCMVMKPLKKGNAEIGRLVELNKDKIKTIIEANRHVTTREIAEKLNVSHTAIEKHLKRVELVKKLNILVPYDLKEVHLTKRINACDLLLKHNEFDLFLKRIITKDEKLIVYNNVNRKRSWCMPNESSQTTSKAKNKILLSIWWDWKGPMYFDLLPRNQTINSEDYCQKLDKMNAAVKEKRQELVNRKGVIFRQDNARPHTSLAT
ncbi:PREDICTED: histone-lysine N-methyltransferase SETMAR-like [Polistes canadensis]|uniref:histone-lysine N-methyltransferase SETMAR-like n=1 Tax=Polistes canadensis TaxID=91411 RepID=UPI000718ECA0|nr:PREDICTED: histone-lysine N-methyltransferase SETMAR-like [Polistes canadensis]